MTREDTLPTRPMPKAPTTKVDFNSLKAPSGYVPGLGRGAAGFTTRSDIGPARAGGLDALKGGNPSSPLSFPFRKAPGSKAGGDNEEALDDTKFDEFMGNDAGVFAATGEYDEDDKEADAVWETVDNFMDERRREAREKRLKEELERYRAENPKITEQFADLKRKLTEVSYEEWESIPEIGDYTIKKQRRMERFAPVPDSLLARAAAEAASASAAGGSLAKSLDPNSGLASVGGGLNGLATPMGGATSTVSDLTAIGTGRGTVLGLKLDRMADSVTGQTVVDPKGYLTDLKSIKISTDAEISDIKKARHLLKSVIQTNPRHAPGWIAAARLEEVAGKLADARKLIMQGCELCPNSEDIWLEAARLQTPDNAKALLARGVAQLPESTKLWMAAAKLETDDTAKARVLRKALERIPTSVRLWKAAVELAEEDDARILLSRAVECCPQAVELWLALARLETYENARKVLNNARKAVPTEPAIWITAAKLEEANGAEQGQVDKIVARAIKSLSTNGVVIHRDAWMKEAENAERSTPAPHVLTCRAIVRTVYSLGVDAADLEATLVADAEDAAKRGSVETARALYSQALTTFPSQPHIWRQAAQLEKGHGSRAQLDELLRRAVQFCPQAEVLWLMAAKEAWLGGDVDGSRAILARAFAANPDSEQIWLAAFKLEFENNEPERARALLAKARENEAASSYPRVWMKSAIVERELGDAGKERALLEEGIRRFPTFEKFYLMLGQLEQRCGSTDGARVVYRWGREGGTEGGGRGTICQVGMGKEERLGAPSWRGRRRNGPNRKEGGVLKSTGGLGSLLLMLLSPPHPPSPRFVVPQVEKARSWFNRAVTLNPDIGDHWAHFYKFECQFGTPEQQADVSSRCAAAEPHHGERWCRVSKDPRNAHQPVEVLLRRTVQDLDSLPPP
ncbi:hypothetical protein VOLCADRAFT_62457 [Volvox carteri f. nagariensis]|uniref:PRP1 splicing factor N-terminal domain-containing protein n=1 Tax=Volvox carteri f. nagariensis TaxID=3068 RepID=D8U1A5_VOLCA|nr:uncharacterized protein VOLCADRAFT_62457 [Volvox carteri f. nagariensis]EFJ46600.1 hypothetical protein VOLCADRAFT_62457 [Volvox carteri f. nagariensis]|eukprot:XP_002952457.1 hypothetical protein VOLCADRAFT_62457 [Volvox carteri f. nagariensis]